MAIPRQPIDPFRGFQIQNRTDMQASDVGVTVAGSGRAVASDDGLKSLVEFGQTVRRNGRVLDKRHRFGVAHHPHQQGKPRFADFPEIILG